VQLVQPAVPRPQGLQLEEQNHSSPAEPLERCEVDCVQDFGLAKWARNDYPNPNLVMYQNHQNDFVTRY